MKPITRAAALRRGLTRYYTGKACTHGHVAERFVDNWGCVECLRATIRAWKAANPEKVRATLRAWQVANREKVNAAGRAYRAAHREKVRAQRRARYAANPEKVRAQRRARYAANPEKVLAHTRAWKAAHRDHYAALQGLARARFKYPGCAPANFKLKDTIPIYAKARRLTRETGIPHEVDHRKALCLGGKHIASNLQVITATANRQKAKAERAKPPRQRRH